MWWSRRATLSLIAPLALAACGFTPVYGPGGAGDRLYAQVRIEAPETDDDYLLVRALEQRLGRAASPAWDLSYTLRTRDEGQAITASGDITRYSVVGDADFVLSPAGETTVIASGKVTNFTGYSATGSTVETLAAERDAHARLMVILADQIVTRLFATADLPE